MLEPNCPRHPCPFGWPLIAALLLTIIAPGRLFAASNPPDATGGTISAAIAPASAIDPMAQVKSGIGQAIAVFQNQQMSLSERRKTLRALAENYFDFPMMARSVLGYHWRTLTPAQRAQFVPLFTGFIEDAYLTKLQDYTVHKVQQAIQSARIEYTKENFDGDDYAQVFTLVVLHDEKNPIAVNYYMHRDGNTWKVYDLSIEAISIIANFRNQFDRVINNQGYDTLLADLRAKQQRLQQDLDHPSPSQ
jgi:phospholipid transport system substrate-binding protein